MTKIIFHRDRFGVHLYYHKMNAEAISAYNHKNGDIFINNDQAFSLSTTMVVPEVKRVSARIVERQHVGYVDGDGNRMTIVQYQNERAKLKTEEQQAQTAKDIEAEVRAQVALRLLNEKWQKVEQDVDIHQDLPFEVVDIDYPADERFFPLRHFNQEKINYFEVNGDDVARKFMHTICQAEGLQEEGNSGRSRRTYYVPAESSGYYGNDITGWRIEGHQYNTHLKQIRISKKFEGSLEECRQYVNSIEAAIRSDFDTWKVSFRSPTELTVKFVNDKLDEIERCVRKIDSKVRTEREKAYLLQYLAKLKTEITTFGVRDLMQSEDDFEKELDELDKVVL